MTLGDFSPHDCSALRHTAKHCNTLQHDREILNSHLAIYFTTWSHWNMSSCSKMELSVSIEKFSAVISLFVLPYEDDTERFFSSRLQHTATHCNILQHTVTHTVTHCHTIEKFSTFISLFILLYEMPSRDPGQAWKSRQQVQKFSKVSSSVISYSKSKARWLLRISQSSIGTYEKLINRYRNSQTSACCWICYAEWL